MTERTRSAYKRVGEVEYDMPEGVTEATGTPRGLLNPRIGEKKYQLLRMLPSESLEPLIEHYWMVAWNLVGEAPYNSETLPYPSVHVVIEKDSSKIYGVVTGKFSRLLKDQGRVFGIKFKPGAFYPFFKKPVVTLTNQIIPLSDVFGSDGLRLEQEILALTDETAILDYAETFLRKMTQEHAAVDYANIAFINRIIDCIIKDGAILKVDDLLTQLELGVSKRSLQRLFQQYVGVSPKWVIKRYRLHEAAEKLATGDFDDWPTLALNLGYFDQAHFIKDFKSIVGLTPADYLKQQE